MDYCDELGAMLEQERLLHFDLRRRGHRLLVEPRARTAHVQISSLRAWLTAEYYFGRLFSSGRCRHWSAPRRALYLVGTPLKPLLRIPAILREVQRAGRAQLIPGLVPVLLAGLLSNMVGEMTGYARGPGGVSARVREFEFDRERHLAARERESPVNL